MKHERCLHSWAKCKIGILSRGGPVLALVARRQSRLPTFHTLRTPNRMGLEARRAASAASIL